VVARAWSAMTRMETSSSGSFPYRFFATFSMERMTFWKRSVS
jgi:hypothetical protein